MPAQKLTIATLNGSVKRKCELEQVYFRTHTLISIESFILDDFLGYIIINGVKDFHIRETQPDKKKQN